MQPSKKLRAADVSIPVLTGGHDHQARSPLPHVPLATGAKRGHLPWPDVAPSEEPLGNSAMFVGDTLEAWLKPQSSLHSGLLAKRPFLGQFDECQARIDASLGWFGEYGELTTTVLHNGQEDVPTKLHEPLEALLAQAALPMSLSDQIRSDATSMSIVVASLCPSSRQLAIKLEILGSNSCGRWHRDRYVGRGIVSYTGEIATEYTDDANVDFWELENCGNNACIIRDVRQIKSVDVGDFLFMKGTKWPTGAAGIVHKSPEWRYHPDGRILNRLCLKIDIY